MSTRPFLFALPVLLASLAFCSAAQASGGTAVGWGYNGAGAVGIGSTSTTGCKCVEVPAPVVELSQATQIAAGRDHTAALLSDGTVRAWGSNFNGQLGHGDTVSSPAPVAVVGASNVVAIAAGSEHTLGLLADGRVLAWGDNSMGALGVGNSTGPDECGGSPCSKAPVLVPGLANAIAVAAGEDFSLALLADGTVLAWGADGYGQVGDGVGSQTGCLCVDHPIPVPGISGAIAISAGTNISEALIQDGTVKVWGENYFGEAGNGTDTAAGGCACVKAFSVSGLSGVTSIHAGGYHATAALADGTVKSWGLNNHGQLGNGGKSGPEECHGIPCARSPISVLSLAGAQTSPAGTNFNLALLGDGTARAWGDDTYGELGTGVLESHYLPAAVSGLGGASEVAAGGTAGFGLIGPSQTLKVALAGAGSGAVSRRDGTCPSDCAGRYPQGQVAFVRATSDPAQFAGFSGPCTGLGTCQVKMDTDLTVTATFGKPKGTKITRAKIDRKKRRATFSFTAPGAITGFQCLLVRPKVKSAKKRKKKPKFSSCRAAKAYKHLKPGAYTFKVRALDILGADDRPATRKFKMRGAR
jgi:alpha-tubulin suppressor-like RCC1 family protein